MNIKKKSFSLLAGAMAGLWWGEQLSHYCSPRLLTFSGFWYDARDFTHALWLGEKETSVIEDDLSPDFLL